MCKKKNTNKKPCCTEVQLGSNCDGVNDKKQKKRYYTASPAKPGIAVTTITEKKRSSS
jgi:hypothetical protein